MRRLILVRHGATDLNDKHDGKDERLRGWLDVPLNKDGKEDGHKVAKELRSTPIRKLYSSDLLRAMDVAEMIAKANASKPKIVKQPALRPWHVGKWAGQEVKKVLPDMLNGIFKTPDKPPPGGEPWNEFLRRFLPFLRKALNETTAAGATVLVSHTRNLRVADGWMRTGMHGLEVDPRVLRDKDHLDTGGMIDFRNDGRGWTAKLVDNDSLTGAKNAG